MNELPIPRDIPLPLPAGQAFLEVLLIVAFLAHILFVNLMVGGTLLVFAFELRGLKRPDFDTLARMLAKTVTVNKSLAVVLGVAPLLLINVLYTIHFYTANALTGTAWILLVPTISATFLLLYLHKYTWDRLAVHKLVHLAIVGLAALLFLVIPLVFLANVSLMMFPEHWTSTRGVLSALILPAVLPRYLHFLCASLIVTSLFGAGYFGRDRFPAEEHFRELTRAEVRKTFYAIALSVSLAQFLVGPLVLFSLPPKGLDGTVVSTVLLGATLAVPAVWLMWKELTCPIASSYGRLPAIATLLSLTVVCMASGRHMVRGLALAEHQREMREATTRWVEDSAQAAYDLESGRQRAAAGVSEGEHLFQSTCGGCHAVEERLVGPPLTEIAQIYSGNPEGIVTWARAPGKKRAGLPQMPKFDAVAGDKLLEIAQYMLSAGAR